MWYLIQRISFDNLPMNFNFHVCFVHKLTTDTIDVEDADNIDITI